MDPKPKPKLKFDITDETAAEYIKQAESWLDKNLSRPGDRTPKNICTALFEWSKTVRPNTYRKMRRALQYQQFKTKNYDTAHRLHEMPGAHFISPDEAGSQPHISRRAPVCKSISEDDLEILLKDAQKRGDRLMSAALIISEHIGCRPKELPDLSYVILKDGSLDVNIVGAKKHGEERGMDRTINLANEPGLTWAIDFIQDVMQEDITLLRKRVSDRSKKLFPNRKVRPTLYSLRHQFASDMKADDGVTRTELAGLMGHQSEESSSVYGNTHTASIREYSPSIKDTSKVRVKKKQPPGSGSNSSVTPDS